MDGLLERGAQILILGCTELPVALRDTVYTASSGSHVGAGVQGCPISGCGSGRDYEILGGDCLLSRIVGNITPSATCELEGVVSDMKMQGLMWLS